MTSQPIDSLKKPSPIVFDVKTFSPHLTQEQEQLKDEFIKGAPLSKNSPKANRKVLPTVSIYLRSTIELKDKIDELAKLLGKNRNALCCDILLKYTNKELNKLKVIAS